MKESWSWSWFFSWNFSCWFVSQKFIISFCSAALPVSTKSNPIFWQVNSAVLQSRAPLQKNQCHREHFLLKKFLDNQSVFTWHWKSNISVDHNEHPLPAYTASVWPTSLLEPAKSPVDWRLFVGWSSKALVVSPPLGKWQSPYPKKTKVDHECWTYLRRH